MTSSERLDIILTAGSVAVGAAAVLIGWRLARWMGRLKAVSPEEAEKRRRLLINRNGRIASAEVVDLVEETPPDQSPRRVVVYRYEVAGVTYEAAQDVFGFSGAEFAGQGLAGLASSVKYDPQMPMNSIIACEEWSGLTLAKTQ